MNIEHIAIVPRQRQGWSAIDLGCQLARHWYRDLFLAWLIPCILACIVLNALLLEHPAIAGALLWWCKPIFDRFPLYIASKRLFGEDPTLRDVFVNARQISTTDALPWLLWRRFNPLRSFVMPVTVLEGLKGSQRTKRLSTLQLESSGYSIWLTTICIHLETLLPFAALMLIALLLPEEAQLDIWSWIFGENNSQQLILSILGVFGMALVAPFYVVAGFMLYIQRRIDLEAWDLELAFRNIAHRKQALETKRAPSGSTGNVAASLLILLLAGTALLSSPAEAQAESKQYSEAIEIQDASGAQVAIRGVLSGEDFERVEQVRRIRLKSDDDETESAMEFPQWLILLAEWLEETWPDWENEEDEGLSFSSLLRGLVIIALAVLTFYVVRYFRLSGRALIDSQSTAPPAELFGLQVTQESLPEDIPAAVMQLWQQGEQRPAVALLYRATLSQLIHKHGVTFSDSDTEYECAQLVAATEDDACSGFFAQLTQGWINLAYGHQHPEEPWITRLCDQWGTVLGDE